MSDNAAAGPAASPMGALTIDSAPVRALLAITFLFPIVVCAAFLPTPASDLREHINFGLSYRLDAFRAPPLQTWLAGAVALTGARDSWLYVTVAQILNFIGLAYLVLIAKRFLGAGTVVPLIIMFCGSVYFAGATPSMALNADQIQVPLWAGIVFHGLMALRDDRWRDWLLCGAIVGVAVLAKYTVILLVAALVVTIVLIPAYRKTFFNVKFYAAGLASLPILALHVVPELLHPHSWNYATSQFRSLNPLERAEMFWAFLRSYVVYGLPVLIGLAALAWRGELRVKAWPDAPALRLILLTVALIFAILLAMIFGVGLVYETRHTYPLFGLSLLAFLIMVRIESTGARFFVNFLLAGSVALVIGVLIYSQVAIHWVQQEPAPAAARVLRAAWDRDFGCGPAYVLGFDRAARAIALYYGKPVVGLAFEDTARTDWLDKDRITERGAIVVATPEFVNHPTYAAWFKDRTVATLTLPYRRTRRTDQYTYVYYFIAPQACPSGAR